MKHNVNDNLVEPAKKLWRGMLTEFLQELDGVHDAINLATTGKNNVAIEENLENARALMETTKEEKTALNNKLRKQS